MEEHLDLDEGGRLEAIKDFASRHRATLIAVAVAVILGASAGYAWHQHRQDRLTRASGLYQTAVSALEAGRSAQAREALRTLTEDFSGTPYGAFGRVFRARLLHEKGDSQKALDVLAPAAEGQAGPGLARQVAVEERARILRNLDRPKEALKVLEALAGKAYLASYFQLKGDLLAATGQPRPARAAYSRARQMPGGGSLESGLKARLEQLPAPGSQAEDGKTQ